MNLYQNPFVKAIVRFVLPIILVFAVLHLVPISAEKTSSVKSAINNFANEVSAQVAKLGVNLTIKNGEYQRCEAVGKDVQLYFSSESSVDHDVLTFEYDFTFALGFSFWIVLLAYLFMVSKQNVKATLVVISKVAVISAVAFLGMFLLRDIAFGAIAAVKGVRIIGSFDSYVRIAILLIMAGLMVFPTWSGERR